MLVFDVELISFMPARHAPPDVKAPPADAKRTPAASRTKCCSDGTGARHPRASSIGHRALHGLDDGRKDVRQLGRRGQPATFPLDGVIPGWTEGLQLMVEGEKTRFWIPETLAYKGQSAPYGMLVFDVELIKIN